MAGFIGIGRMSVKCQLSCMPGALAGKALVCAAGQEGATGNAMKVSFYRQVDRPACSVVSGWCAPGSKGPSSTCFG